MVYTFWLWIKQERVQAFGHTSGLEEGGLARVEEGLGTEEMVARVLGASRLVGVRAG